MQLFRNVSFEMLKTAAAVAQPAGESSALPGGLKSLQENLDKQGYSSTVHHTDKISTSYMHTFSLVSYVLNPGKQHLVLSLITMKSVTHVLLTC